MARSIARSLRLVVPVAPLMLLAACGAPSSSAASIDSHPATLVDAKATAEQLEQILAANPNDPEVLAAKDAFHARLDELNHLVARIEPRAGHVVSFFANDDGAVAIAETQPKGEPSVVDGADLSSPAALYRALTGGQEPPAALATLEPRPIEAVPADLSPGPGGSSDEATGSRIHVEGTPVIPSNNFTCYAGGDFNTCQPVWGGGGSWNKNAKTSFLEIDPTAMLYVELTLSSGGGFMVPVNANTGVTHLWAVSPAFVYTHCAGPFGTFCSSHTDYAINNHNWQIVDATNIGFSWSTEFRWNCTYTACNTL